ncbi:hypothetical protein SAMN05661012_00357 [Chitinophaga sancti]|uniref:Uncharacterized protein n=1 Tax=Chitinophaga sancti TaxID=1004 RepID=A0A1K1M0T3_9BACT|nr:hypothetical protein SAMN05661012_00357 [Chitinophaga sancti]
MSQDFSQLETRIKNLTAYISVVQEEAIRIMKEVEQLSASLPSRGNKSKKKGNLSDEFLAQLKMKRLAKIKVIRS